MKPVVVEADHKPFPSLFEVQGAQMMVIIPQDRSFARYFEIKRQQINVRLNPGFVIKNKCLKVCGL